MQPPLCHPPSASQKREVTLTDEFYNSIFEVDDSDYLSSWDFSRSDNDNEAEGNQSLDAGEASGIPTPIPPPGPTPNREIPPPPFKTPPKLKQVEDVMNDHGGKDVASLRNLTTALARDAIFGKVELAKKSLSGRKNTGILDKEKLNYIKTLVKTRVPAMTPAEFEHIWTFCRGSLSKSCQALRANSKRK